MVVHGDGLAHLEARAPAQLHEGRFQLHGEGSNCMGTVLTAWDGLAHFEARAGALGIVWSTLIVDQAS